MRDILTIIGAALGFVTFLGATVVYLRGSRDKGTIETLEKNNKALADRVLLLEQTDKTNVARIRALEQTNRVLEGVANSGAAIENLHTVIIRLVGALDAHHGQAMTGLARIHTDLVTLRKRDR